MVGQCLFCSWYGVRLRRAAYVEGGPVLYHPHCVRIALNSPDPSDRALAERIFKTEMPKLARNRFWEMNPPNVTVNPEVPTQELSIQECDRLCRENAMGTAETIERFLAGEPTPAAHASLPPAAPEVPPPPPRPEPPLRSLPPADLEEDDDEATRVVVRRLWNEGRSRAEIAERLAVRPKQISRWLEDDYEPRRKREKRERSNVERAMEVVSRLSPEELEEFQARMARLSGFFGSRRSAGPEVLGEVFAVEA